MKNRRLVIIGLIILICSFVFAGLLQFNYICRADPVLWVNKHYPGKDYLGCKETDAFIRTPGEKVWIIGWKDSDKEGIWLVRKGLFRFEFLGGASTSLSIYDGTHEESAYTKNWFSDPEQFCIYGFIKDNSIIEIRIGGTSAEIIEWDNLSDKIYFFYCKGNLTETQDKYLMENSDKDFVEVIGDKINGRLP